MAVPHPDAKFHEAIQFKDTAVDPTGAGELQRNGPDLEFHDGVAARTLLHVGDATKYVVRDATAFDKTVADFTTNGAWYVNGLDLSPIVPVGTIAVDLHIVVKDNLTNKSFTIRRNVTQAANKIDIKTQVANIAVPSTQRIAIDSDRLLDYYADNTVWTVIDVAVIGYVMAT